MSPLDLARWFTRRTIRTEPVRDPPRESAGLVRFQCNLCGSDNAVPPARISREIASCAHCQSTVRLRGMAHLVVREVLRVEQPLAAVAPHRRLRGIGLSDDRRYAPRLAHIFDYENTFLDAEPKLDITAVPPERSGRYDFVTSSDVFEHVAPPVQRAFDGARALLRPGGVLILTVPFTLDAYTVEHFPELYDWRIERRDGAARLHNVTRDGRTQRFDDLVFHEGPGPDGQPCAALEMRVFSRASLERACRDAGFARVRFVTEPCARFGIEWPEPFSMPMVAYAE